MTRVYWMVFVASIIGINVRPTGGEEIAINYKKIEFDYVEQTDTGVTFGGDSTLPALPADFFGPGSEPFSGNILLKGKKILQNLVLERTAGAVFDPPSAPQDIPLEMVELDLESVEPIVITYSDGLTEQWDMTVNLDKDEKSSCWIRVSQGPAGESDGGSILPEGSYFDVFAELMFTHTPMNAAPRHRFFAIVDRTQLTTTDAKWADRHSSIAGGANREFIPGADPSDTMAPLQVLYFDGGGLDLSLRVTDVVPEPSSITLIAMGSIGAMAVCIRRRTFADALYRARSVRGLIPRKGTSFRHARIVSSQGCFDDSSDSLTAECLRSGPWHHRSETIRTARTLPTRTVRRSCLPRRRHTHRP